MIKMWSIFIYRIVLRCIQIGNQTANKLFFELINLLIPFLILLFLEKSFCVYCWEFFCRLYAPYRTIVIYTK